MSTSDEPKTDDAAFPHGRKFAFANALASARIEGYEPDAESLADFKALEAGTLSSEDFRARTIARGLRIAADNAARKDAGTKA